MATYKVIQDIEAEDHILGPLSLRQFIYALVAAFTYYLCFLLYTKGAGIFIVLFLPIGLFMTFFAFPFGKDQSTEVWALAQIRFLFKPRKRVWDQSGVKELVTITAPKTIQRVLTNGLDQDQVRSRLNALANTIDSRGWAIKNINVNNYAMAGSVLEQRSDRLVEASTLPQAVPSGDMVTASDDMLDTANNQVAHQFDQMINQSAQAHHQQLIDRMNAGAPQQAPQAQVNGPAADYWFMQQQQGATAAAPTYQPMISQTQAQNATPEEEAVAAHAREMQQSQQVFNNNLRTIQPIDDTQQSVQPVVADDTAQIATVPQPEPAMTQQPDPAILNLANNNDLNVATIAREANKAKHQDLPHDEVVISLR